MNIPNTDSDWTGFRLGLGLGLGQEQKSNLATKQGREQNKKKKKEKRICSERSWCPGVGPQLCH